MTDDVRVMLRPFRAYRSVAEERSGAGRWAWLAGPLRWLLVVAATVSWITAGRLVWHHLPLAALSWAFLPALQVFWIAVVARVARNDRPLREVVGLYFLGHGPWLFLLVLVAGVCLFAPEVWPVFTWLLDTRVLPALFVAASVWCVVLSVALFRSGLGMSWRRTGASTLGFYAGYGGCLAGYFWVTDQLPPLLGITA